MPIAAVESMTPPPAQARTRSGSEYREPAPQPKWRKGLTTFGLILLTAGSFAGGVLFHRHYVRTKQVIVAVNGAEITQQDLFTRMEKADGVDALRQLVTEQIQVAYAKDRGVMPSDAVVTQAVRAAMSDPTFKREVADNQDDLNAYVRQVQVNLAKAAVVTQGINVTEAEIRAYYDENVRHDNPTARFYIPESTTLQLIRNHSQAAIEAAARDLRNGRDFAAVAADYSTDPSREHEGVTAPLVYGRNSMRQVPGMERAIFSIEIGDTLGPRQFAGDWWIFKCVSKTPAATIPFERAHLEAEIGAKMAKVTPDRMMAVQEDFDRFQKGVNLQVFWPKYQDTLVIK